MTTSFKDNGKRSGYPASEVDSPVSSAPVISPLEEYRRGEVCDKFRMIELRRLGGPRIVDRA